MADVEKDTSPTHYAVKLQRFSMLAKNNVERYESAEFESGGYKWKLIVYPNGNKSKNVNDNISLYVMLVESCLPDLWSEVHAVFRVFLFNQNDDSYYILQGSRRFHKMKLEWGFDRYIPLEKFNDLSNGYLVDDTCVFGAEVNVCNKNINKGEKLVMMSNVVSEKHSWKIDNFSTMAAKVSHESMPFNTGDHKWKIQLSSADSHISMYLCLVDATSLPIGSKIYTEFTLNIIDQLHAKNNSFKTNHWFDTTSSGFGLRKFISVDDFNLPSKGFLVKDKCIIEAEVTVHGVTTAI